MKNRDGYEVIVCTIEKVDVYEDGSVAIHQNEPGWGTFHLGASELNGFVPQADDVVVVYTQGFSMIRGVAIDGRVFRYITPEQAAADHEQWKKNLRLEKLERYLAEGDELKARVKKLHPALQARMERFAAEGGVEFWIDSADYEMYALEGATAIVNKANDLYPDDKDARLKWAKDWWDMNTKEGGYDYKGQMEILPEFGDGHSGNTAGAAYAMARMILEGKGGEL